jgi:hypothetical protein
VGASRLRVKYVILQKNTPFTVCPGAFFKNTVPTREVYSDFGA